MERVMKFAKTFFGCRVISRYRVLKDFFPVLVKCPYLNFGREV